MNSSPQQPEDKIQSQEAYLAEAARRRRQHLLARHTNNAEQAPSLGEILLPFLFAALETCWIDAIFIGLAGFGLFQSHEPLMPLWAPFVLIIGTQWIASFLERRAAITTTTGTSASASDEGDTKATIPGSGLLILFVSLTTLFVIWLSIYSQTAFFLNPAWLLALLNDVLLLNLQAYHIFVIIAVTIYLCWRAMRLLYRQYEPSHVFGVLRLGMGIIVAVLLVRAAQTGTGSIGSAINDDFLLLLLIPVFLFLALAAHALARVTFERYTHPFGFEDDVSLHERSILVTIGMVGVLLLITAWLVDTLASPAILAHTQQIFAVLGQGYDWFVRIFATIVVFLATPVFWVISLLITLWTSLFPPHAPPSHPHQPTNNPPTHPKFVPPAVNPAVIIVFLKVLFPILLVIVAIFFVRWIMRRRRRVRVVTQRKVEELHESLWSWTIFWLQFKALLRVLFGRFFPQKTALQERPTMDEFLKAEPTARSIREIYRALLKRAAARGYPRKKHETPSEFRERLDAKTPLAEPRLDTITEAYMATRYGDVVPDEFEVARVQQEWTVLDQKWREV